MLNTIKDISIYPSFVCNQRCVYCRIDKDTPQELTTPESIGKFIATLPLAEKVTIRFFGGEPTMEVARIKAIAKQLVKVQRKVETQFSCVTYSNGTDADALLELLDNKILVPESTKISWDGVTTCQTTRPTTDGVTDEQLKANVVKIGQRYGNRLGLVHAIHPMNIHNLHNSLLIALDAGYRDFSYYLLQGYAYPKNVEFMTTFKEQLHLICQEYAAREHDPLNKFQFHNLNKFRNVFGLTSTMSTSGCSGLGESLAIAPNGVVYGCPCTAIASIYAIGHVTTGIDPVKVTELERAYANPALCALGCKNAQCHRCPVTIDIYGELSEELTHSACMMSHAETEVFNSYN